MKQALFLLCLLAINSSSFAQTIPCPPNLDFELGTYANWHYYKGSLDATYGDVPDGGTPCCPLTTPTYCGYGTPCIFPNIRHALVTGWGVDPYGGFPVVAPGGTYSMKIGNSSIRAQTEKIRYYVHVPPATSNYLLVYRYAMVLEDPTHPPGDQPRFEVNLYDSTTGALLPCGHLSYVSGAVPGFYTSSVPGTAGNIVLYRPWDSATVNLSGYGGSTIAVDFATADCRQTGHFGYAYVDMRCGTFTNYLHPCDTSSAISFSAPPGYASYTWYDSATLSTVYGTTQTVTLPNSGGPRTYAIVMTPYAALGGCPITSYLRVEPSALKLHPSRDTAICLGDSVPLAAGATDILSPLTYSWAPATGLSCTTCASVVATPTTGTTYTVTVTSPNGCHKDTTITVYVGPPPGVTTGPSSLCVGSTITLSNSVSGGTWSASSPNATIDAAGVVTGTAVGTAAISYSTSLAGCGTSALATIVTVNGPPSPSISGPLSVCVGGTQTLTGSPSGGAWSTASPGISVSSAGVISGLVSGTTLISYTATNSCGTTTTTAIISVDTLASPAMILAPATICMGSTFTLASTSPGGIWNVSPASIATLSGGNIVTGVNCCYATISYVVNNACGISSSSRPLTVNPTPYAFVTSGPSSLCAGSTATLAASPFGGTWSATGTGTVSATGVVTGLTGGTVTVSYTVTDICGTAVGTKILTVNALPAAGTISGPTSVCVSSTITLTSSVPGSWTTTPSWIGTINPSGVVSGISAGTLTVICTFPGIGGCSSTASYVVTVNPLPTAGTIVGPGSVCAGGTISLTNSTPGGTWSSTGVATVSATGVVTTGSTPGTATVSYSVTNMCGTAVATKVITINPLPAAGTITGPAMVCVAATVTMTSTVSGGTWSISGGATISSAGVVSGVSTPSAIVTYIYNNTCGADTATRSITVNPLPDAGTINGPVSLCAGTTWSALVPTVPGGTWSSSPPGMVTISSSGVVSAGSVGGTATIIWTVTNVCGSDTATTTATVVPPPATAIITGPPTLCPGTTITLGASIPGGVWTSTGVATVSSTGIVTAGTSVGTATISYTLTDSCGSSLATRVLTVNMNPDAGSISGPTMVCTTHSITMSATVAGGTWSCSPGASISSSGVLTGSSGGTTTVTYSVTNICGTAVATTVVTVNPTPPAGVISSLLTLCAGGTATLTSTASGGSWSTSATSVATVTPTGVVYGVAGGTALVTYTVSTAFCTSSVAAVVTVDPLATPGVITGAPKVCTGAAITLSGSPAGGYWSSSGPSGSVSSVGVVSGLTMGTITVTYTTISTCGNVDATHIVSVQPLPDPAITGPHEVCVGATITLSSSINAGTWSSSNAAVAYLSAGGLVSALSAGTALVSYTVTVGGCTGTSVYSVTVSPLPPASTIAGPPQTCVNGNIVLTASSSGGTWTSSNPGVASVDLSTGQVHGVGPGTAVLTYTTTNAAGCLKMATFPVTILTTPAFVIKETLSNVRCKGSADGSIAVFPTGGAGPWNIVWGNGSTSHTIKNLSPGEYLVEVTDSTTTCHAKKNFVITEPDSLEARSVVSDELCGQSNGSVTTTVKGGIAPYKYMWSDNSTDDHISDKPAGVYTVAVRDDNQCLKELAAEIAVGDCKDLVIHDGVSPNGDGVNDIWVIDGIGLYKNNLVQLFDKWGDKVFEQYGYDNKWDGKGLNGSVIPDGTYFYIVKLNWKTSRTEGKDLWTGSLLIKR